MNKQNITKTNKTCKKAFRKCYKKIMWQEQHNFTSLLPNNTDVTEEKVEFCMRRVIGQVQRSRDSHSD